MIMEGLYIYLLKAILSLGMVYAVYAFFLRKLTFFQWNRWYLLLYSLIAFLVPFIDINEIETLHQSSTPLTLINQIPSISHWVSPEMSSYNQTISHQQTISKIANQAWIIAIMMFVSVLLLIRLGISIYSLFKIARGAEVLGYINQCKIIRVNKSLSPFSFSNIIFIGNQIYAPDELEKILTHEMIHTQQRHSVDMILGEILIIVAWWNPFSWLIRKSIRQNLEFIADREVIKKGVEIHPYQMLLLKTMHNPAFRITNAFSFSHLKKRIMMMNIKPSHRLQLARFLLIAPAFLVLALLFRSPITNAQETASQLIFSTSLIEKSEAIFDTHKEMLAQEKEFLRNLNPGDKTFILYNEWLYWKPMENESRTKLEKPENLVLKVVDDTIDNEQVNKWFANHKRNMVSTTPANKNNGSLLSLKFYTEAFSLPKPTKTLLVNENYQPSTLNHFRENFSNGDAVFINGFRAYRNSGLNNYAHLLSGNENAIVVYKLTGALAANYSEKASVVWWIETKKADEIHQQPDFESTKRQINQTIFQNGTIMPCNYGLPDGLTFNPETTSITVLFNQPHQIYALASGTVVSVFGVGEQKFVIVKHANGDFITYGDLQSIRIKKGDMVNNGTLLGLPNVNKKGEYTISLQYDTPEGTISCKNCVEAIKKLTENDF